MGAQSAIESFTAHRLRSLDTLLEEFPQRAEYYLEVATLTRRVGSLDLSQLCLRSWSGNLELRLLPTVLEFEGHSRAFDVIICAARAVHIWSSFYTGPENTKAIFDFLFENFPKRIDEFIQRTVESAGYRRRLDAPPCDAALSFSSKPAGRLMLSNW